MPRTLHKLTDRTVKAAKKPGRMSDGGGLFLRISPTQSKSWSFMWTPSGKPRKEMGLGPYPAVSLSVARDQAAHYRSLVATGGDPEAVRNRETEPTFGACVEEYISAMEGQWENPKHRYQWSQTLGPSYCSAILEKKVSEIGLAEVLEVLRPVWSEKPETASRLRGRLERVLNFAKVKGWRIGENPALWRGNLENVLPKQRKRHRVKHHAALPYDQVPDFMAQLRQREAVSARALEFLVLTAARTGEVIGAQWSEIDFDARLWVVPAERMKLRREHRVPLTDAAMAILDPLTEVRLSNCIFPGQKRGAPLSNMAMMNLLKRMGYGEFTCHGFRSSFRDWCGDTTSFPREIAEAALAHLVGNEVERSYRRSDALEKRRKLMEAWASCCHGQASSNVVPMTG